MSNSTGPITSTLLNSNGEKKAPMLATLNTHQLNDSISVVVPHTTIPEENQVNLESKINQDNSTCERTTRKECYRLGRRKLLFEQRRKASDYALFFAMIGLVFMVLEQEFTMAKIYDKVEKQIVK